MTIPPSGLATYGYNVTRAMGVRLAKLSPTRGFCAELSTALVIMICAQYGLPTSSSQVITGGIIGVGLCEVRAVFWPTSGQVYKWTSLVMVPAYLHQFLTYCCARRELLASIGPSLACSFSPGWPPSLSVASAPLPSSVR